MSASQARLPRPGVLGGLVLLLLAWNGVAALYANPFTMTQGYDGTQYQLLARNRLAGHDEVGDSAHTVRSEGWHPMWRPGVVFLEEGLARCLGSVQAASACASALGTTLLELAMLWLAWRCFGTATALVTLAALLAPIMISVMFLRLAPGQGPECWAAATVLLGLAGLVETAERRSWRWAVAAGGIAGLAEWFRTGNTLLFAVPCAVYGLAALRQRPRWTVAFPALALAVFLASSAVSSLALPSRVNKSVANLWGNLVEYGGLKIVETKPGTRPLTFYLGGLALVPGTSETYYDYIVRSAQDQSSVAFLRDHAASILAIYGDHLSAVVRAGASGVRLLTGDAIAVLFVAQLLLVLFRRDGLTTPTLALAGAALAFYLGPVVFLRGDDLTHYLYMILPLVLLVAARGAVSYAELAAAFLRTRRAEQPATRFRLGALGVVLLLSPFVCLSVTYYLGALDYLRDYSLQAAEEQHALDQLGLNGRKVACRRMSWFVDRPIQTVLLPYATVAELADYARAHDLDGILVWGNEPSPFFQAHPYGTEEAFDQALRASDRFGPAQVSGSWSWYPLRSTARPPQGTASR
jgi:hypothetical protein